LIRDFATLTGAARVALGPDLPATFANRDDIADALLACARDTQDPLWRMPLWRPCLLMLDSAVADLANAASRQAGAITAALYLERFVPERRRGVISTCIRGTTAIGLGGRGGEAQGLRAYLVFLRRRYPK